MSDCFIGIRAHLQHSLNRDSLLETTLETTLESLSRKLSSDLPETCRAYHTTLACVILHPVFMRFSRQGSFARKTNFTRNTQKRIPQRRLGAKQTCSCFSCKTIDHYPRVLMMTTLRNVVPPALPLFFFFSNDIDNNDEDDDDDGNNSNALTLRYRFPLVARDG